MDWVRDLPVLVFGFARSGAGRPAARPGHRPGPDPGDAEPAGGGRHARPARGAGGRSSRRRQRPRSRPRPRASRSSRSRRSGRSSTSRSWSPPADGYALAGDLGELAVPESLHALLAARLDALDPVARSLAGDAAVIAGAVHRRDAGRVSRPGAGPGARGAAASSPVATCSRSAPTRCRRRSAPTASPTGCWPRSPTRRCPTATSRSATSASPHHLAGSARNEGDALAEVVARHHLDALEARPERRRRRRPAGHGDGVAGPRRGAGPLHRRAGHRGATVRDGGGPDAVRTRRRTRASRCAAPTCGCGPPRRTSSTPSTTPASRRPGHAEALRRAHGHDRLVAVIQALRGRALRRTGHADRGPPRPLGRDAGPGGRARAGHRRGRRRACRRERPGPPDDVEELTAQAIALAEGLDAGDRLLSDTFNSRGVMLNEAGRRLESIAYFRAGADVRGGRRRRVLAGNPVDATSPTCTCSPPLGRRSPSPGAAWTWPGRWGRATAWPAASRTPSCACLRIGEWDAAVEAVDGGHRARRAGRLPRA